MIPIDAHALFRKVVRQSRSFLLTTHVNPDGDAVGSVMALARFLVGRGKEVRLVAEDRSPESMRFLEDPDLAIEPYERRIHEAVLGEVDRIVLLDNSAPDRLGVMEGPVRSRADATLCIDHHATRGTPWRDNILDTESCATAAMVYELLTREGHRIAGRIAEAIYIGLMTDTGMFRFNSTTPRAHEIAADLLRADVDPARCYREIYERNSPAFTRLLGHVLATIRVDAGGAVVSSRITREMVSTSSAEGVDPSDMTTSLLAMDGVRVAILFRELPEGRVKVSLRSKGEVDVHRLASEFGGGGHRNASGVVMPGTLDDVERIVIERAEALF